MCICIFGHQQIQFSDKYKESTLSQILHNFRCWTTQIHHGEIEDNYKLLRFPDFGKPASRPVCPSLDFPRWSLPSPLVIPAWPDSRLGRTSHDVDGGGGGGVNVKAAKKTGCTCWTNSLTALSKRFFVADEESDLKVALFPSTMRWRWWVRNRNNWFQAFPPSWWRSAMPLSEPGNVHKFQGMSAQIHRSSHCWNTQCMVFTQEVNKTIRIQRRSTELQKHTQGGLTQPHKLHRYEQMS